MGNSLEKLHVSAAYRNTTATSLVDAIRLEKFNTSAAYRNTTADSLLDLSRTEKFYTTVVVRQTTAGFIDQILLDKFWVTAVYRAGIEVPAETRRIKNVQTGKTWPLAIYGTPVLTADEDEAYDGFTVRRMGGTPPITYSLQGTWPDGITIDDETGVVSGTPTEGGTFASLSIRATDSAEVPETSDLATFTLEIESSIPPEAPSDPYFEYVLLLVGANGADASTTFIDESSYARTLTTNGNAQIDTAQSKFGGSSALFDGTGDYITAPDSDDWRFNGAFTIECWMRVPSGAAAANYPLVVHDPGSGFDRSWGFYYLRQSSTDSQLNFEGYADGFTSGLGISSLSALNGGLVTVDTWHHVVIERDNLNKMRLYFNGTMVGSATGKSGTFYNCPNPLAIGAQSDGSPAFYGWIDEVRITRGIARYASDSGFTVTTEEFPRAGPIDPYWSYVVLLMKAEGTDTSTTFIDDSSYNHTLTAVNNVQIDTAQYKFGSSSALFDGSGDYISAPDHAGWDLSDANSDQFTVEAWIRPAAGGGTIAGQDSGDGAMSWLFGLSGTNLNFQWTHTGGYFDSSLQSRSSFPNSLSLSAWHHVAVDKDATGKIRLYIDGATVNAVSAPANSAIFNASAILKIGSSPNLGDFNGHIDELRITKGIARYAADSSYTIPTETFPQAGTPSTTADSTSIKADTTSYTADKS